MVLEHQYRGQKLRLQVDLIEQEAKKLEDERDLWQAKDPYFLFSEALLQIAIVLASGSIPARSGPIFSFSPLLAVCGGLLTLNGYFLFFRLPFMHAGH